MISNISSSSSSKITEKQIRRTQKFSSFLFLHGFYKDNTLTGATKSKERHLLQLKRNQQSMVKNYF